MKSIKFIATLALLAMLVNPGLVLAGQLKGASVALDDSQPSTSTGHDFAFTIATGGEGLTAMKFSYCKEPSGGCTTPDALTVASASFASSSNISDAWLLTTNADGVLIITNAAGQTLAQDTIVRTRFAGVTNSSIAANCDVDADTSSDSCFVQIQTCRDLTCTAGGIVDTAIVTYTVVNSITVSARVDPTFTFVVRGIGVSTTNNGIQTTRASQANSIPFGNLTVGTPAYAAHELQVITNTQGGYTVSMKMAAVDGVDGVMGGVYSENNIDPFTVDGGGWGTPQLWESPDSTTPNDLTGWLGANTTDTDVPGWSEAPESKFGPVQLSNNVVMQGAGSDSGGIGTRVYVTYAIEVNVRQPADTYTGRLIYSALPTY